MEQKCIKLKNMDLYFVKTDKFKSIDVEIFFCGDVSKEEITWRNVLMDILLYANKKYPSKRELSLRTEELYSLFLHTSNMRFGNNLISKIGISFLNPEYTEEGMFEDSLNLLRDIISNPLVSDGRFNKEYLDLIKDEHRADTRTISENPRAYSQIALLENMGDEKPYTFTGYSDLDELDKINEFNLYQYYEKFLKSNRVFAIIVGDYNEDEMVEYFNKNFPINNNFSPKDIVITHDVIKKEPNIIIEDGDYQQSKLAIAFKMKDLTDFEYRYVLNIYNSILGSGADSKLMQHVREQNSLAYYIYSTISKADQLMFINSGINSKNYEQVIELIKVAMNELKDGDITTEEINKGKMDYIIAFDTAMESASGYIDIVLGQILFDADTVSKRKEEIMKVTKEDIMKLSSKIHMDTIYLLRGEWDGC